MFKNTGRNGESFPLTYDGLKEALKNPNPITIPFHVECGHITLAFLGRPEKTGKFYNEKFYECAELLINMNIDITYEVIGKHYFGDLPVVLVKLINSSNGEEINLDEITKYSIDEAHLRLHSEVKLGGKYIPHITIKLFDDSWEKGEDFLKSWKKLILEAGFKIEELVNKDWEYTELIYKL